MTNPSSQEPRVVSDNFGFYAILTEPKRGYDYLTQVCVELQVPFVQLRMKGSTEYQVLRVAEKLYSFTHATDTRLIINDFPRVACDAGADGVHLGQEDMAFDEVRAMVGPQMLIGLSTHNPKQTEEACARHPDYIGIGPVYVTPTKKIADPVIGIDGMKAMLEKATVPSVCIGGISFETLPDVMHAGAKNFCMVRPVCSADDPRKVIKKIQAVYKSFVER